MVRPLDPNRLTNSQDRNDNWQTPIRIYNELDHILNFDIDLAADHKNHLCPLYLTEEQDALKIEWHLIAKRGWLNPPYRELMPWLCKIYDELFFGFKTVALLPPSIDHRWFIEIAHPHAENYIYVGEQLTEQWQKGKKNTSRIRFVDADGNRNNPTKGNLLSIFGYEEGILTGSDNWRKL